MSARARKVLVRALLGALAIAAVVALSLWIASTDVFQESRLGQTLSGDPDPQPPEPPLGPNERLADEFVVELSDGRTLGCVDVVGRYGGISCDWANAEQAP